MSNLTIRETAVGGGDKILEFVRRRLTEKRTKSFGLAHLTEEGHAIILTRQVETNTPAEREKLALDIAAECENEAWANVETHERPQRYGVVAFDSNEQAIGRHDFRLAPPIDKTIGGETEAPNATGVLAMQMRHGEISMRLLTQSSQQNLDRLSDENERLRSHIRLLESERLEVMRTTQDLLDRKVERDMRIEASRAEQKRVDRAWGQLEALVPALMAKHGFSPEAGAAANPLIGLLRSLRPEQREAMMNLLDDEQVKLVFEAAQPAAPTLNGASAESKPS